MKRFVKPKTELGPLLAFGAHPDDIEFGCGGVIVKERLAGRPAHFVISSKGEAGSNGTPPQRVAESKRAAKFIGASLEFIKLDGDAHLEIKAVHAVKLARIVRSIKPAIVLAPTVTENQHVTISVSDVEGKNILEINRGELSPGEYFQTIDAGSLSKGIYFVRIQGETNSSCSKLIVE